MTVVIANLVIWEREYPWSSELVVFVKPAYIILYYVIHSSDPLIHIFVVGRRDKEREAYLRFAGFQEVACQVVDGAGWNTLSLC